MILGAGLLCYIGITSQSQDLRTRPLATLRKCMHMLLLLLIICPANGHLNDLDPQQSGRSVALSSFELSPFFAPGHRPLPAVCPDDGKTQSGS